MEPFIRDKVETLKNTHLSWMSLLFTGPYNDSFINTHKRIGYVHVEQKIPPMFVSACIAYLRAEFPKLLDDDPTLYISGFNHRQYCIAIIRVLDLCQFLIDRTYYQSLMELLGISPSLLVKLMTTTKK